ncbi:MAG: alcohol dehydrogenase catalytic domain-containing protein [Pseudomonadales bacterium]|nr:alcohol dehydrogenase catalytic domain-containing protein [Pseudomonadales bacterium]
MNDMQALVWNGSTVELSTLPIPLRQAGEALIRVRKAGICNTDLEIIRGYHDFRGVLGHEFVGEVVAADDSQWLGKRIVSDINLACMSCQACLAGHPHHCHRRHTLGIHDKNGAFAQFLTVPQRNLVNVPETIDDDCAVFAEPLAAALEILDQLETLHGPQLTAGLSANRDALVIGDGKLGLLISMGLAAHGLPVSLLGHHPEHAALLTGLDVRFLTQAPARKFPLVVEATGNPGGFASALQLTEARGTLVLKSTYAGGFEFNPAPLVINEITLLGSRCGPMAKAMSLMQSGRIFPQRLISARFAIREGLAAIARAGTKGVLKVLLEF